MGDETHRPADASSSTLNAHANLLCEAASMGERAGGLSLTCVIYSAYIAPAS